MSEFFYIARKVHEKLDEALHKKASDLGVKEAVYFNVTFGCKDVAKVDLWAIQPFDGDFDDREACTKAMSSYLNAEIGPIATQLRDVGVVSCTSNDFNKPYAIAIYGQQIGSDIFLTGICSKNSPSAVKQISQILAIYDVYSPTSDYLQLCESYGCPKEPPPD